MRLHQESIIKKLSYSELFEPSPPAGARTSAAENIPSDYVYASICHLLPLSRSLFVLFSFKYL
jgi:hypothetical protein